MSMVSMWLRLEGLALLIAGLVAYGQLNGAWLALVPLLLLPDLSMVGYLSGPRAGAIVYDLVHNLVVALGAIGLGLWMGVGWLTIAGVVLVAHVGGDRLLGYGLKYETGFKDTHSQRV
ncbi:MAG: DUF4260 family protein [Solirubrobacterales bacterium]